MKRPLKKIFFYKKKAFKAFCLFVYRHIQGKSVTSVAHLYAKHISGHCRAIALLCLRKFHRLSYVNISFTAGASYLDTADKEFAKKGKAKEMTQAT